MRLCAFVMAACAFALPAIAAAQEYSNRSSAGSSSVLRPAMTVGWRNYVTVPDGPCGHPMSVQADCYDACRPCGPLRPICFLQRVGRMLDCLIPCNLCCRGGCGGHGCVLGGRSCGHGNSCCGGSGCGGGSNCFTHPCGSAFANCSAPSCTTPGHSHGCSSALPGPSNPFQDDPLPPKPTAQPATEVLRAPIQRTRSVAASARVASTTVPQSSPYKIIAAPTNSLSRAANRPAAQSAAAAAHSTRKLPGQSVLRRASAEDDYYEPAPHKVDHSRATPIIRSQSPEAEYEVPANPLRR
jgi:hypothetical protein